MTYDTQKRLHVHHIVAFFVMQDYCRICEYPSSLQKFCLICACQRLLRLGLGSIYSKSNL